MTNTHNADTVTNILTSTRSRLTADQWCWTGNADRGDNGLVLHAADDAAKQVPADWHTAKSWSLEGAVEAEFAANWAVRDEDGNEANLADLDRAIHLLTLAWGKVAPGFESIVEWESSPERTLDDVLLVVDRAIRAIRASSRMRSFARLNG